MQIPIIYEDEELIVVDKPAGLICNRAETVKSETLQDWMQDKLQFQNSIFKTEEETYFWERSGLVHRLDKETAGVMVLAKTYATFILLLAQFKAREVQKEYLALTHGLWRPESGIISLPIGRARTNRKMMAVREDGRESVTEYLVLKTWKQLEPDYARGRRVNTKGYGGFSLVRFAPKSGRMHQIRVHAKHLGHPLVGDELYAGRKRSREDRKWCQRVMLTAISLELTHPSRGRMKFESKMDDIQRISTNLC